MISFIENLAKQAGEILLSHPSINTRGPVLSEPSANYHNLSLFYLLLLSNADTMPLRFHLLLAQLDIDKYRNGSIIQV